MTGEDFSIVSSNGVYCFNLTVVDDEIVEGTEMFRITLYQDSRELLRLLTLSITDNDGMI